MYLVSERTSSFSRFIIVMTPNAGPQRINCRTAVRDEILILSSSSALLIHFPIEKREREFPLDN